MQARARARSLDNIGSEEKRLLPELRGSGSPGVSFLRDAETDYDELLLNGIERRAARDKVYSQVSRILGRWKYGGSQD